MNTLILRSRWLRELAKRFFRRPPRRRPVPTRLLLEALEDRLTPVTHVWDPHTVLIIPGDGVHWSDPYNWADNNVPANGDTVQFGSNTTSTDDIPNLGVALIHFTGSGNTVNGTTPLTLVAETTDVHPGIGPGEDFVTIQDDAGGNTLAASLPLKLSIGDGLTNVDVEHDFQVAAGTLVVAGNISEVPMIAPSGADRLFKIGAGTLELRGTNTEDFLSAYGGVLTLNLPSAYSGLVNIAGNIASDPHAELRFLGSNQLIGQYPTPELSTEFGQVDIGPGGLLNLNGFDQSLDEIDLDAGGNLPDGNLAPTVNTGSGVLTLTPMHSQKQNGNIVGSGIIEGNLSLGGGERVFDPRTNGTPVSLVIAANMRDGSVRVLSDNGGLATHPTVEFRGQNTYAGPTTVLDGTVLQLNSPGLHAAIPGNLVIGDGSGAAGSAVVRLLQSEELPALAAGATVSVNADGLLDFNGNGDNVHNLNLKAGHVKTGNAFVNIDGSIDVTGSSTPATISGGLDLLGNPVHLTVTPGSAAPADLVISANMRDTGGILKDGAGSVELTGDNTYTGTTTVAAGLLRLNSNGLDDAVSGNLVIGDGTAAAEVRLMQSDELPDTASVTVNGLGTFNLNGNSTTVGTLFLGSAGGGGTVWTGTGLLYLGNYVLTNASPTPSVINGRLDLTGGDRDFLIGDGPLTVNAIVEAGGIIKDGFNTLVLTGANTYTDATTINSGVLQVDGTQAGGPITMNGGVLKGDGTVGTIFSSGGTVAPGDSPGVLRALDTTLDDQSFFSVELDGTTAGTQYSQLAVTGAFNLGGATLIGNLGYTPANGDSFTIITSTGPISGKFAQGASVTVGGTLFTIVYNTNSVVLMATATPELLGTNLVSAPEGSPDLTVFVIGDHFTTNSLVQWNGAPLATTFLTSALLRTTVPAADLSEESTATIIVTTFSLASTPTTFTVTDPPVVATGGYTVAASEGADSGSHIVATFKDPGGAEALTDYSAAIDWGDGQTSPGTITFTNGAFAVCGSHLYGEEGNYAINVSIVHDGGSAVTVSSTASVSDPVVIATGGFTVSAVEGATSTSQTVATVQDPGGAEALTDYSAAIDWGDGQTSAGTITFTNGVFSVSGSHLYGEERNYAINVSIVHDGGPAVAVGSSASVIDPAVIATGGFTLAAVEGAASASQTVATFKDPGGPEALADYSATIAWGDQQTSSGVIGVANGVFTVSGSHAYAEEGNYPVKVSIVHDGGAAVTVSSTASVADAALSATAVAMAPVAGAPFTGTVATFKDADPSGQVRDFSALIAWGDGSTSAGVIGPGFTISGGHTFAAPGTYLILVTVADAGGTTSSVSELITVTDLGKPVGEGLTGDIGFWQNRHGQALIDSFNGGAISVQLASWLAQTFPNLYGAGAGVNNLTGKTNAQVAAFYLTLFAEQGPKLDAQVLATALSVYTTTSSLGGNAGSAYGFTVSAYGLGAYSFNVGQDGAAFDVPNNTKLNVDQMLLAVNRHANRGVPYNGSATLRRLAADAFGDLLEEGGIDG